METLEEEKEEHQQSKETAAQFAFPIEIIEQILSRLPVKSVLRFKSVCKQWLSCISDPSFTERHLTRSTSTRRTALFYSSYDRSTQKHYFFSAARDGGPVTHLMTLDHTHHVHITRMEHLNGLLCITCVALFDACYTAYVINPSTRKIFELPHPTNNCSKYAEICCLFGFDESRNEHKVLFIGKVLDSNAIEFFIFSISNHTWRKIDVELPAGFSSDYLYFETEGGCSVCVNSVIHVMLLNLPFEMLAFDLITEKLSMVSISKGSAPFECGPTYARLYCLEINGCLGVVCENLVWDQIDIWILQDYDNRVWVRKSVELPQSWYALDIPVPPLLDALNMDEIIMSWQDWESWNVMSVPIFNTKTRRFKSLQFPLSEKDVFACSRRFDQIRCYTESMVYV